MADDGRSIVFVPLDDINNWGNMIKQHKPKVIFLESPSNPLADLADIRAIYTIAKEY
jgi:O-succinylhomoserine sulfhydrylase